MSPLNQIIYHLRSGLCLTGNEVSMSTDKPARAIKLSAIKSANEHYKKALELVEKLQEGHTAENCKNGPMCQMDHNGL